MSLVVCCPCGNPLECDDVGLVVTLTCPHCERELTLEFSNSSQDRQRAVLTVMEGPHWLGERFLMPVGLPLMVGGALGNWLSLDGDNVSDLHCELRLTERGNLVVEDRGSDAGTWLDKVRVKRGRLEDKQSITVGEFRLRVDFQLVDGSGAPAAPATAVDAAAPLPEMAKVRKDETPGTWMARNRFQVSRGFLTVFAWLTGAYHWSYLCLEEGWEWYWAGIAGFAVFVVLADLGRRVALVHPYMNYISLVVLLALTVLDITWHMPVAAIASFLLIVSLALLALRPPGLRQAIVGVLLGTASLATIGAKSVPLTIDGLSRYIGSLRWEFSSRPETPAQSSLARHASGETADKSG